MNRLMIVAVSAALIFAPLSARVWADEANASAPIQPPLVREGDFAVELAGALNLGDNLGEAAAESALTSDGISPRNGWIADYPVTPQIYVDVQNAVASAADSGKLAMGKDKALAAVTSAGSDMGLTVAAAASDGDASGSQSPPPESYAEDNYTPDELESYYYDEGPPIYTYYAPPWDYYYLYDWVDYPFWWGGGWFPGFFVLGDFDRDTFVHHGFHGHGHGHGHHWNHAGTYTGRVSNHVTNRATGTVQRVSAQTGRLVSTSSTGTRTAGTNRFGGVQARQGAGSIMQRSLSRGSPGAGASSAQTARTGSSRLSSGDTGLGTTSSSRTLHGSSNSGSFSNAPSRSFSNSNSFRNAPNRSFSSSNSFRSAPSRSFSSGSFRGAPSMGSFHSSSGFSGGGFHSGFSGGSSGGGFHGGGFSGGGGGGFHGGGGGGGSHGGGRR